jgi:hypothetical protein
MDKPFQVIARYREDISWAEEPFFIVQKGEHIENKGREASSYLWWIIENYNNLPDTVHFLQGNPFEHTDRDLNSTWFPKSQRDGCHLHCGLRIEEISEPLGLTLPDEWTFPAGANFKVSKQEILKYDLDWYKKAFDLSMNHEQGAWIFERLWVIIYTI